MQKGEGCRKGGVPVSWKFKGIATKLAGKN